MGNKVKIAIGIALTVLLNVNLKQQLVDFFVEKAEYSYNYMLWFLRDDLYFTEKGYRKEDLQVVLYWKDGAYYFMPLDECDTEIEIDGEVRKVCHNKFQEEKYIFYKMEPWTGRNRDCEWWYIRYEASVSGEEIMGFRYLGIVEIDTSGNSEPEVPPLEKNTYIDAAMDYICEKGDLPEGNYEVYISDYEYREANKVEIMGVIRQGEVYRPFWARVTRNDVDDYEAFFFHTNGTYELFPPEEDTHEIMLISHMIQAERLVIDLEITAKDGKVADLADVLKEQEDMQTNKQGKEITSVQALEMMEYMYNYYQWFYVKMPYEIEQAFEEGETYTLFTDGQGNICWYLDDKRFGIYQSDLQADITDLPLSSYGMDSYFPQCLEEKKIGTIVWHSPELQEPDLPLLEEDEYINAVEAYIRERLSEKEQRGEYRIWYGRYEILSNEVRNISVAVVGEENYFAQFWVTRWQDDTYECFPINSVCVAMDSLEMGKVERIVQLDRLMQTIEIE